MTVKTANQCEWDHAVAQVLKYMDPGMDGDLAGITSLVYALIQVARLAAPSRATRKRADVLGVYAKYVAYLRGDSNADYLHTPTLRTAE